MVYVSAPETDNSINVQELFVTLGRVEAKVDALAGLDTRLRNVENKQSTLITKVSEIEGSRSRKAPWTSIILAIGSIITAVSVVIGLFVALAKIAALVAH